MKKTLILLFALFLGNAAFAQKSEMELFRDAYKLEKKALLVEFLELTNEEATTFWPVYEEYQKAHSVIADKRIALMQKYAEEFATLSDEQADALAKESFAVRAEREKLQKTYYKKFKKANGAKRAAQFVQFERFIQTAIDSEINETFPLIGEKL